MWQFSQLSSRVRTKESEHVIGGAAGFSGQQMMKGGEEVWGGAKEVWKTEGERTSRSVAPEEARAIRDRCVSAGGNRKVVAHRRVGYLAIGTCKDASGHH